MSLLCVLYTEKNDELAAIELMLRMRKAELRGIVVAPGPHDISLQPPKRGLSPISSITQNLEQQTG